MTNPFAYRAHPATTREHQENANHFYYELQGAEDELNAAQAHLDRIRVAMPSAEAFAAAQKTQGEAFARAHTLRWVYKEHARIARQARAALEALA